MLQQLQKFLIKTQSVGYASGNESAWKKQPDGSTTIEYRNGDWKMQDNFFGGEPYGGRTIVFYQNKPYWIMVYYGAVSKDVENVDAIYAFLRKALLKMPEDAPYRGPKELTERPLQYKNTWQGELQQYSGEEEILQDGKQMYWAKYMGGLVDERRGV